MKIRLFLILTFCVITFQTYASETDIFKVVRKGNIAEIERILVQTPAAVNQMDKHGATPLSYAIKENNIEICKLLITRGAKIENDHLWLALETGNKELIKLLIDNGADPDYGLHRYGPFNVDQEVTKMLLEAYFKNIYKNNPSQAATPKKVVRKFDIGSSGSTMTICFIASTGGLKCISHYEMTVPMMGNPPDDNSLDKKMDLSQIPFISGLESGVMDISMGFNHTCVVMLDGKVKCWGKNDVGQLGDGTHKNSKTPVEVAGIDGKAVQVEAGYRCTCVLTEQGAVKCWGYNFYGNLGDGTTTDSSAPVQVKTMTEGAVVISTNTGEKSSYCALINTGEVRCWGKYIFGQVYPRDNGMVTNMPVVTMIPPNSAVAKISVGSSSACALLNNGGAMCWGSRSMEGLNYAARDKVPSPVEFWGLDNIDISVGVDSSCVIKSDGSARCIGSFPGFTQPIVLLSYYKESPVLYKGALALNAGSAQGSGGAIGACAMTSPAEITCWGTGPTLLLKKDFKQYGFFFPAKVISRRIFTFE